MLRITLIRHGKTAGNSRGEYIGRTDEHILPEEIPKLIKLRSVLDAPGALFVSPYKRCTETASVLYPGINQIVTDGFRECDFGEFEGKTYRELRDNQAYRMWIDSRGGTAPPGGESGMHFRNRVMNAFREVIDFAAGQVHDRETFNVAIVAHGGTIMSILAKWGIPSRDYYGWQSGNGEGFVVLADEKTFAAGTKDKLHVVRAVGGFSDCNGTGGQPVSEKSGYK